MNRHLSVLTSLLWLALVACAMPLPTATADPIAKIRLGYTGLNSGISPVSVAYESGFFQQNGLEVTAITSYRSADAAIQDLRQGKIEFALAGPPAMLAAEADGADLVMILGLNNTLYYDFIVQPQITQGRDLQGKRVGVAAGPGASATAARYALTQIFNLDPDRDVTLVPIGNEEDRLSALQTRQIDATVLSPFNTIKAKRLGLSLMASLWNVSIPYQTEGVVVNRAYLNQQPQVIRAFTKSVVQATAFYLDPKNHDPIKKILIKYVKSDDAEYVETIYTQMTQSILQRAPYVTEAGMQMNLVESKAAMAKGIRVADVIDNSFVQAVDDSGLIKALTK